MEQQVLPQPQIIYVQSKNYLKETFDEVLLPKTLLKISLITVILIIILYLILMISAELQTKKTNKFNRYGIPLWTVIASGFLTVATGIYIRKKYDLL